MMQFKNPNLFKKNQLIVIDLFPSISVHLVKKILKIYFKNNPKFTVKMLMYGTLQQQLQYVDNEIN